MPKSAMTNAELQADANDLIVELHRRVDARPDLPPRIGYLAKLFHFAADQLQRALHAEGEVSALSGGDKP